MSNRPVPTALIILDGWGYRAETDSNAIANANTPTWDRLLEQYPNTLIRTSGEAVGLPEGQMGNSEVGHMNLGAGRIVYQEFTRINKAIADGDFFTNPELSQALAGVKEEQSALHIMGLLSPGGVHSHEDQILALVEMAAKQGLTQVYLHAFLDGRDTPPQSALASIQKAEAKMQQLGVGKLASLTGRYYAMDRDQRWERVEKAYKLLTLGEAEHKFASAEEALAAAYAREETDEFVQPSLIGTAAPIKDGDALVFMNFRADRARQLTQAFVDESFTGFARQVTPKLSRFVCLTHYADTLKAPIAFPPQVLTNTLGDYLSNLNKTQLRIAETEKYAHVTFFFSGGKEAEYKGETRKLIASPQVTTYDLQPEMSAYEVTDELIAAVESQAYDLIVCNFANGDMVGHTGKFDAAVKAVEVLDECLGKLLATFEATGSQALITADHGNAELMQDPTSGQPHTAHTNFPVPLILIHPKGKQLSLAANGSLQDIAPSLLQLMQLPQPPEMTGKPLVLGL